MAGRRLSWSRMLTDTLPRWADRSKKASASDLMFGITFVPLLGGTIMAHMSRDDQGRFFAVSTLNYAGCVQAVRLGLHSGMQSRFFGLPSRSMELHPLISVCRYLSALLPFGLVVVSLRASFEFPHLSARYLLYSCGMSTLLDAAAYSLRLMPSWLIGMSFLHFVSNCVCLTAVGSCETVIVDIK